MSEKAFSMDEFIRKDEPEAPVEMTPEENTTETESPELDVQKAVVEELAADKAMLDEDLASKTDELEKKEAELAALSSSMKEIEAKFSELKKTLAAEQSKVADLEKLLASERSKVTDLSERLASEQVKIIDMQERNPNALALLDREIELPDRFPGETRDHVIEVIREAREKAEADGRLRRAQILEAVLIANEPNGTLAKNRAELEKLFADNGNILTGTVLEELAKRSIPHKNGEEYLLPAEIIKRTY